MTKQRRYDDTLDEDLSEPIEAVGYLNACSEDSDPEVFLLALRDIARAPGGIAMLKEPAPAVELKTWRLTSKRPTERMVQV